MIVAKVRIAVEVIAIAICSSSNSHSGGQVLATITYGMK